MKDEFTTVPVLENFGNDRVIGELKIRNDALPLLAGFVFSIGFKCLEKPDSEPCEIPRTAYTGPYELMCISPVADENYIGYLRQVGKLPPADEEMPQNVQVQRDSGSIIAGGSAGTTGWASRPEKEQG